LGTFILFYFFRRRIKFYYFVVILFLYCGQLHSQTLGYFVGTASGPATSGPSTGAQTITFYQNATTPSAPSITATFTLSNQQFSTTEGNPTIPGVTFGSMSQFGTTSAFNAPASTAHYQLMNGFSSPSNGNFTACNTCTSGTGIDITQHRAVALLAAAALITSTGTSSYPLNSRVRFADLTITFSRPVNNPILHLVGLGGFFTYSTLISGTTTHYYLGYSAELDGCITNLPI
jgi:hypothetical protein